MLVVFRKISSFETRITEVKTENNRYGKYHGRKIENVCPTAYETGHYRFAKCYSSGCQMETIPAHLGFIRFFSFFFFFF